MTGAPHVVYTQTMDDNFLKSALREEARLVRRLAAVRALIADYRGEPQVTVERVHSGEPLRETARHYVAPRRVPPSKASQVTKIAEDLLTSLNRRAKSAEIFNQVKLMGVELQGVNPESVVSSYLSSSDKFDNVRGEGYGLKIWNIGRNVDEAPPREPEEAS